MKYFINDKEVTRLEFDTAVSEEITEKIHKMELCKDKDSAINKMYMVVKTQLDAGMISFIGNKSFKVV